MQAKALNLKGIEIKHSVVVLRLTRGWKISIIGAIVAVVGWILQGFSIFGKWGDGYNFYFASIWFAGILAISYGLNLRQREKKNWITLKPKATP